MRSSCSAPKNYWSMARSCSWRIGLNRREPAGPRAKAQEPRWLTHLTRSWEHGRSIAFPVQTPTRVMGAITCPTAYRVEAEILLLRSLCWASDLILSLLTPPTPYLQKAPLTKRTGGLLCKLPPTFVRLPGCLEPGIWK